MAINLKQQLITCLKAFGKPELAPQIKALQAATKPIYADDKELLRFIVTLIFEMPELMQDPKGRQLQEFCRKLGELEKPVLRPKGRR